MNLFKISKNKFSLGPEKSSPVNFNAPFMNLLRSAVEHRPIKASEFFDGEIFGIPQCFSTGNSDLMYHGTKSSIQERLPSCPEPSNVSSSEKAVIIEASPLLRKLSNVNVESFHDFAVTFYRHVVNLAKGSSRVDIIFDRYFDHSIKAQTRKGCDTLGTRITDINDDVPFPNNFLSSF